MKLVKDVLQRISEILSMSTNPFQLNAFVIDTVLSCFGTISKGRKKTISFLRVAEFITNSSSSQCDLLPAVRKIQSIHNTFLTLIKSVERNSEKIENYLLETSDIRSTSTQYLPSPSQSSPPPKSPSSPSLTTLNKRQHTDTTTITTPAKTRRDCNNCSSNKKVNISLFKTLKVEKSKNFELKTFSATIKKRLNVKYQKLKLDRKEKKIRELKQTLKHSQLRQKCVERKNQKLMSLKASLQKKIVDMQIKIDTLKNVVIKKEEELETYYSVCDSLETRIKEYEKINSQPIITKGKKAYDFKIRRLIYNQLICDVPVKHCGYLLNTFAKVLCGRQLADSPSPATCAQMAYELGVLTMIQAVSFMLTQKKNICLSWDATSIDGCHINEIHITVDRTQCLVLDVRHLPGGKTSDYVSHIITTLTEAADVYARFMKKPSIEIFAALKSMITSTLTDRAAVNGVVTRQLCEQLETQLIQLYCNIHPLDSVARQANVNLKNLDQRHGVQGNCYGSEGAAANLINAVSVLRFRDGTGDPAGFKNMLRHHNLSVGTFVRYVGNRIHVLFHLAGILVLHWDKLNNFLQMQCTAGGLLWSRLLKDLENEQIMAQVWALGVMG